jgi:hypothetical protein
MQVIRDIRDLGFSCASGEDTSHECSAAYNAVVCIFDSMHAMAHFGGAVAESGRKLVTVVDEAHQIVQDNRYTLHFYIVYTTSIVGAEQSAADKEHFVRMAAADRFTEERVYFWPA